MCHPPFPIFDDQTKESDTLFMAIVAGTAALNIIYKGVLLMVFSRMLKKGLVFSSKNLFDTQYKTRVLKP